MPPKDRPNRPNTAQITFRVPIAMADWLRDRARDNARQPGAELMLLLKPTFDADMKRKAWEEAQRAQSKKTDDPDAKASRKSRRKAVPELAEGEIDLFAVMEPPGGGKR